MSSSTLLPVYASMMDAKQRKDNSYLLEASPSVMRRSRSHERVSLSQLAAGRLESLKWLMARDLTVSPPGRAMPRSAGGTPGNRPGGDSGDRKTTWRSSSVDVSGNFASESESGGDGTFLTPRLVLSLSGFPQLPELHTLTDKAEYS